MKRTKNLDDISQMENLTLQKQTKLQLFCSTEFNYLSYVDLWQLQLLTLKWFSRVNGFISNAIFWIASVVASQAPKLTELKTNSTIHRSAAGRKDALRKTV